MTWRKFKAYFDPHVWIRNPAMRATICDTCHAVRTDLDRFYAAKRAAR